MAADQMLSDEQLIAVAKSGDSSLLRALTPDEKNRIVALSRTSDAPYMGESALLAGRRSAAQNRQPEGGEPGLLERLKPMLESAAYPKSFSELGQLLVPDAPGGIAGALHEAGRLGTSAKNAVLSSVDMLNPDLVSIASPRAGAALRMAQRAKATMGTASAPEAAAAKPVLTGEPPAVPMEDSMALTRRLKAENMARAGGPEAAKAQAFSHLDAPAGSAAGGTPPPVDLPPAAAPGESPAVPASMSRTGTVTLRAADRTAGQMSPTWVQSDLGLAARRLKVTLTPDEIQAGVDLVKQGASPAEAVVQLKGTGPSLPTPKPVIPAAESKAYLDLRAAGKSHEEAVAAIEQMRSLQQMPGVETPAQAAARVAERNRTGRWRGSPSGKQIRAKADPPN